MQQLREVKLPSGATLKVGPAEFAVAKALYQQVLRELRFAKGADMKDIIKDIMCIVYSSPDIEACLWECFKRCLYNTNLAGSGDLKITADTFEDPSRRGDYMPVCLEVATENIRPFAKSLYAQLNDLVTMAGSIQA